MKVTKRLIQISGWKMWKSFKSAVLVQRQGRFVGKSVDVHLRFGGRNAASWVVNASTLHRIKYRTEIHLRNSISIKKAVKWPAYIITYVFVFPNANCFIYEKSDTVRVQYVRISIDRKIWHTFSLRKKVKRIVFLDIRNIHPISKFTRIKQCRP